MKNIKEAIRNIVKEESEYQTFFKKALEKSGKSISQMSDEEKKVFFNKIDAAWDGKGEKNEELVGNQHKLDVDGDGEIEASDLAALRAGKKKDESLTELTIPVLNKLKSDIDGLKVKNTSRRDFQGMVTAMVKNNTKGLNPKQLSAVEDALLQYWDGAPWKFSQHKIQIATSGVFATESKVNENFSPSDVEKIKKAVQDSASFMQIGRGLQQLGFKYSFGTSPYPIYMIKKGTKTYVLINKKYADDPEFVIGDTAGGLLEGVSVNEAVSVSHVRSTIEKVKKQLIQKWKQKGGYENFGEKEGRMLSDKFNANPYGSPDERRIHSMIQDFENWAMNYDGRSESVNESITYSKDGYVKKMVNGAGKMVKEITLDGVTFRYNPVYKTYNSVKNNELLHKSHLGINESKFKSGDKVSISHPTMTKPVKGVVSMVVNASGNEVLVLKGDGGVWDAKFAKLNEGKVVKKDQIKWKENTRGEFEPNVNAGDFIMIDGKKYKVQSIWASGDIVVSDDSKNYKTIRKESINEGNAFGAAVTAAKKEGKKEFEFNGKKYKVKKGSYEKNESAKKLAEKTQSVTKK